jgi:hypothetical protein
MVLPLPPRRLAAAALLLALLASCSRRALGFTLPDQYEKISAFRDAMLARPGQQNWTKALASWRCPTDPANTVGSSCDPCGQQVWGNWEHLACRGPRISFTESQASLLRQERTGTQGRATTGSRRRPCTTALRPPMPPHSPRCAPPLRRSPAPESSTTSTSPTTPSRGRCPWRSCARSAGWWSLTWTAGC